jgi:signal peptidase I
LWIALATYAAASVGLSIGLALTVLRVVTVPTSSMERTVPRGSSLVVDHAHRHPRDGDMVVFNGRSWGVPGSYVKRVIASGGETVACCTDGAVTVDGRALDEPYAFQDDRQEFGPVAVPPHRLWVMGDNRSMSADSRVNIDSSGTGTIAEGDVVGEAHGPYSHAGAYWQIRRLAAAIALPIAILAGLFTTSLLRRRSASGQAL